MITTHNRIAALSPLEQSILRMLTIAVTNREIANAFGKTEDCVKQSLRLIFRSIAARNRTHAALLAVDFFGKAKEP